VEYEISAYVEIRVRLLAVEHSCIRIINEGEKMLKLKDIHLGSTDAKNEVLSNTPEEIAHFLKSFVTPPALTIEKFFSRHKYYIVGLKGTGKTALLRYLSLKLEEDEQSISSFVLFKSDVDEDLKKDFSRAARVQLATDNVETYDGDDFETVWRWFIYRKIASVIQDGLAHPFQENGNLASFLALVGSEALIKSEKVGLMRLVPNIRKGSIEISENPKLGFELDWDKSGRAKVNFNDLVRRADNAFELLDPDVKRLNIFFDELELNYGNSKQYQRDSRLVRDLIVSVERLNSVAKRKGFPLCLYAAVRSEVLVSVESLGKEINKPITDFGSTILWNRPGLDAAQQPLLNIIERRINNARSGVNLPTLSTSDLWKEYFPEHIHDQKPQVYILHNSWYRPRDVVRLLISIQDQYPNETSFILQGIEAVRKSYSTASWVELTEELKAKYKPSEVDGIKYIFYGFRPVSSLAELTVRANAVAQDHAETKQLLERISLKEILKDLFRVGIIGNIEKPKGTMRFSFRGDDEILFENGIFVHNALRAHLSIFR
jgi:hypothetical protein